MSPFQELTADLRRHQWVWLVTGTAGFIGSNLLEALLQLNQRVIGLDNFSTGSQRNLDEVCALVGANRWRDYVHITGDTRDLETCHRAAAGADFVLHQAALGSVPRSLADPIATHSANVTGFINMAVAARDAHVKRFVYASSSSVYGDHPALPKVEEKTGRCLSPYAATKLMNEIYADVFSRCYGLETIGLRYFNVFGPRQDPSSPYSGVIAVFADRVSASTMRANQLRIYLSVMGYTLMTGLRRWGLQATPLATAQVGTIRVRLLKIGALVRVTVRKVWVRMASSYPYQALFSQVLQQLRT